MSGPAYQWDTLDPLSPAAEAVGLRQQVMAADLIMRGDGWERGVRSVLLQNDRISLEVVVDRGLDIAGARISQIPVGWRSPTEIVAPWFVENAGFGPHRGFFGGLLTTCGLDHIGAPTERSAERFAYPSRTADSLPMHGRVSGSPARLSAYGVTDTDHGIEAFVEGTVTQVAVFGEHLVLSRRISIAYGSSTIRIADTVTNRGYAPSPLAVMYHVNVGWPVVAPGARVEVDGRTVRGDGDHTSVVVPTQGAPERTWLHVPDTDRGGRAAAAVVNERIDDTTSAGMRLSWDATTLPTLVQWELTAGAGHYAVALEPSTMAPGPDGELALPTLEPGASARLGIEIELLHASSGVDSRNNERQTNP